MIAAMTAGNDQSQQALRATMTRTLPNLGAGVDLFSAPVEAAGNSKLRISLASSMIDLRV